MPPPQPPPTHDSRPYYREHHALSLKVIADDMITTGNQQVINARSLGVAVSTLEKYVSQSSQYLADKLGTTEDQLRYTIWRRAIRCKQLKDRGCVVLQWKVLNGHRFASMVQATPENYAPVKSPYLTKLDMRKVNAGNITTNGETEREEVETTQWRDAFDEFVLGEGKARFAVSEVDLSEEDMGYIRGSVIGMGDVKVVRLDRNNIVIERL